MKPLTKEELAIKAIEHYLDKKQLLKIEEKEIDKKLIIPLACFVTVYVDNQLRGCIGSCLPEGSLYLSIIKNAVKSAFFDPRFIPITKNDLSSLKISVSVLTPLQNYYPKSNNQLIGFLKENKPGLLIKKDNRQAVFLPQVWDELREPESFLSQLCLKAGLAPSIWREGRIVYQIFYTK